MKVSRTLGGFRAALTAIAALGVVALGCIDRPVSAVKPRTQSGVSEEIRNESIEKVDLLLMVDNSGSMRENQANIMEQFQPLIETLVNPPCVNEMGAEVRCDPANPMLRPKYPPVKDLHVGVVSSDLGTPGSMVPGCANTDLGDDGVLNPIRNGMALADHLPWAPRRGEAAPPGFRPDSCRDQNQFPSFISFCSGAAGAECAMAPGATSDAAQFVTNFRCNAGLFVNGCGLEQQLEAVWRALVWHNPRAVANNTDVNAGFVRDDALLAILFLTDEEDGSVRDCRFARGAECTDAIDVFNSTSTAWSNMNLNLRFYLYQPGSAQDPTWNLNRYIDPANPNTGYLSLKPGHPERVVIAAITGVPLDVPMSGSGENRTVDWNALLGAPSAAGADDFNGRDQASAYNMMSREGPVSMRLGPMAQDPNCSERTVPACRREGSPYAPTNCTTTQQYFAWPSRRVVEIARRMDQSPLCNGQPCRNGTVASICSSNYSSAMRTIVEKIQSRLTGRCLPRVLQTTRNAANQEIVDCVVREYQPADTMECEVARGRVNPGTQVDGNGQPMGMNPQVFQMYNGERRLVCDIVQIPTDPMSRAPVRPMGAGWFYERMSGAGAAQCAQAISFTTAASPRSGSVTRLECIQSVTGVGM